MALISFDPGPLRPEAATTLADALAPLDDGRDVLIEAWGRGQRFAAGRSSDEVALFDADGRDVTGAHPALAAALGGIEATSFLIEGVTDADSVWLLDLRHLDGDDWSARPLRERLDELGEIAPVSLMPERVTTEMRVLAEAFCDHLRERRFAGAVIRDPNAPFDPSVAWGAIVTWDAARSLL